MTSLMLYLKPCKIDVYVESNKQSLKFKEPSCR